MYDTVKKHDKQIDDLQKKSDKHEERINTLETQGMATKPEQTVAPMPQNISVKIPDDVVRKQDLAKAVQSITEATQKVVAKAPATSVKDDESFNPTVKYLSEYFGKSVSETLLPKIPKAVEDGIDKAFAYQYQRLYDIVNKMRYKADNIIQGQWWRVIPKWIYIMFAVLLLASGGFGYGFFSQLNEIDHLKDVEWMYRGLRVAHRSDEGKKWLLNFEKDYFRGTTHEQDSIRINIREWEKATGMDKTYIHFYPTEE